MRGERVLGRGINQKGAGARDSQPSAEDASLESENALGYFTIGRQGRNLEEPLACWLPEIRSNKLERH
jgi:hypothetical protein